jgi:hypothetical protein
MEIHAKSQSSADKLTYESDWPYTSGKRERQTKQHHVTCILLLSRDSLQSLRAHVDLFTRYLPRQEHCRGLLHRRERIQRAKGHTSRSEFTFATYGELRF